MTDTGSDAVALPAPIEQTALMGRYVVVVVGWVVISSALALLVPGDPTQAWFSIMVCAPIVVLPAVFFLAYRRSPRLRATMLSLDFGVITTMQGLRMGGFAMVCLYAAGSMNPIFGLWAGSIDVFIAVTALPVAYLVAARPEPPRRFLRAWHTVGLLDFAVAVPLVLIASPSSMRLLFDGPSTNEMLKFPLSFIPMVGVPIMTILHITALLQLRAGRTLQINSLVHPQLGHPTEPGDDRPLPPRHRRPGREDSHSLPVAQARIASSHQSYENAPNRSSGGHS